MEMSKVLNKEVMVEKSAASEHVIKTATGSSEQSVVAMLVLAFSADPAIRWLYPDPHQYMTYWPEFVMGFGGGAFDHGTAYHTEGFAGAALWLPPDTQPDEDALVALFQQSVDASQLEAVFSVLEQTDAYHPGEPYWYLPIMGVDPIWQGCGCGSTLLQHTLDICDCDQMLAYLESSNPRNIPLYERHGFEVAGTVQAGTSPPLYPMVRNPRPVQSRGR
jgi:ribosomal protein S18 acetylase RimI-like enzyme